MFTILVLIVGSVSIIVMLLLVTVVIGIRQEPSTEGLREQAPSLIAAFVRRLLGTCVRKPNCLPNVTKAAEDHASLPAKPLVAPRDKSNLT